MKRYDFILLGGQGRKLCKRTESGRQLTLTDHVRHFDAVRALR